MAIQIAVAQSFTEDNTLGDDMLEKCANVCRINIFSILLARHAAQDESITSQHPLSEATFAESN